MCVLNGELRLNALLIWIQADELGAQINNPAWDYVPPELVSLFITNKYVKTLFTITMPNINI